MVEKWLSGNRIKPYKTNVVPAKLFKDSDKDGVANVFDCKPHNKRKQDVISPFQSSHAFQYMLARQENERLQRDYWRQQQQQQLTPQPQPQVIYTTVVKRSRSPSSSVVSLNNDFKTSEKITSEKIKPITNPVPKVVKVVKIAPIPIPKGTVKINPILKDLGYK